MMLNPELYAKYNGNPKRDAIEVIKEYTARMKWKEDGDRIIDVGCGDGDVTVNVLKKYLPSNFIRLVGLDISEDALKHARDKYGDSDPRLQFLMHDIQKDLPVELRGSFDKVFSSYVFHFVPDHAAAFRNMYELLTDGGTCVLSFLGTSAAFETYSVMSQTEKWKPWLVNVDQLISPYQFSKEPVTELQNIMKNAGFNNVEVKIQRKTYIFKREYLKQIIKALNTFKLSGKLLEDFVSDFVLIGVESGLLILVSEDKDDSARIQHNYDLFIVTGSK